jgi:hypothetical protein
MCPNLLFYSLKRQQKMYATVIYVTAGTDYGNSQYLFEIIIIIAVITRLLRLGMDWSVAVSIKAAVYSPKYTTCPLISLLHSTLKKFIVVNLN